MGHSTGWWVAGMGAALLALNTAQAQSVPDEMTVRVYNSAGLSRGDVAAAQRVADRIFESARGYPSDVETTRQRRALISFSISLSSPSR